MSAAPPPARPARDWLLHPVPLAAATVGVYLLSLQSGWLGYDDDWLIEWNELLNRSDPSVVARILCGFDYETRMVLGAEYLPVRDLVTWILRGVLGLDAPALRVAQLGLYVAANLLLQRWAALLGRSVVFAVWIFALHPVHAESVAWLAGIKDILALLFVSIAILLYARGDGGRWWVPVFVALACLSKGVAVVAPGLLLASDMLARRPVDRPILFSAATVAAALACVHAWVGAIVHMYAEPLANGWLDRLLTVATMLVRYVGLSLLIVPSSLFYEVDPVGITAGSISSVVLLLVLVVGSAAAWRRGVRWPAASLLVLLVGLAPVLQLLAPLQNRMADRYLLFAVLGPSIAVAFTLDWVLLRVSERAAALARISVTLVVGTLAMLRALLFTDPIAIFDEGTSRTEHNAVAPFMLAQAYLRAGRLQEAEIAYRIAIDRDQWTSRRGLAAGNNLGRLLVQEGRLGEARTLFVELTEHYPDDARSVFNLARVEDAMGDHAAADRHDAEVAERFPDYRPGMDRPGPL